MVDALPCDVLSSYSPSLAPDTDPPHSAVGAFANRTYVREAPAYCRRPASSISSTYYVIEVVTRICSVLHTPPSGEVRLAPPSREVRWCPEGLPVVALPHSHTGALTQHWSLVDKPKTFESSVLLLNPIKLNPHPNLLCGSWTRLTIQAV